MERSEILEKDKWKVSDIYPSDEAWEEENELEEFEIYLMNFCQKQPTCEQKNKLSLYLSSLMKKLAYYKIVC